MNKNNIDKLIHSLSSVKMTVQEKTTMHQELLAFTRSYSIPSPYTPLITTVHRSLTFALVAILAIGSISKPASAKALPGELLYPVKIIHEEIEAATKNTSEKKISHEIKRAEKRIHEAAELAERKILDTEAQAEISKNLEKHTNKAKQEIQIVKKDNPLLALELNTQLEESIKSNVATLKKTVDKIEEETELPSTDKETQTENEVVDPEITNEVDIDPISQIIEIEDYISEINELDVSLDTVFEPSISNEKESVESDNNAELLLGTIEADLVEAEAVSQEVQDVIIKEIIEPAIINEGKNLPETDILESTISEEEIVAVQEKEEDFKSELLEEDFKSELLEEILSLENEITILDTQIDTYHNEENPRPEESQKVEILKDSITRSISEKDYEDSLNKIKELLVLKQGLVTEYENKEEPIVSIDPEVITETDL